MERAENCQKFCFHAAQRGTYIEALLQTRFICRRVDRSEMEEFVVGDGESNNSVTLLKQNQGKGRGLH